MKSIFRYCRRFRVERTAAVVAAAFLFACSEDPAREEMRNTVRELAGRVGALEAKVFSLQDSLRAGREDKDEEVSQQEKVVSAGTFHPSASLLDDPFVGNKRAGVLVMAFSNFQCKPCRLFHKTTFQELRDRYGTSEDVQVVFRDFPLENNEWSAAASSLAHCAGEGGGYWKMFDILVRNEKLLDEGNIAALAERYDPAQADRLTQCARSKRYEEEIAQDRNDGETLGAKGAPGVFIGARQETGDYRGVFIRGAQPAAFIDREIRRVGAQSLEKAAPPPASPQEIS